jgi:hypothetical protein
MAKAVDPRKLPDPETCIPGLKPPVREFARVDDSDPSEVDAFNQMIRELRNLRPAARAEMTRVISSPRQSSRYA